MHPEDKGLERKIGSESHNVHLVSAGDKHKPTAIAPAEMLKPLDPLIAAGLEQEHKKTRESLVSLLGEPYFSAPGFILYKGDCLDIFPLMAAGGFEVDLTVTSPPYNIGKEYEVPLTVPEYVDWCTEWMAGVHSVTGDAGAFWLNLGYLKVPGKGQCVPIPYLLWDKTDFHLIQEVVWQYGAGVSAKRRLSPRNEKWLFYVNNGDDYTFNLDDIRDPNVKYPNQKRNGKFRCNPLGKNPSDVWEFPKVTTGSNRSSKERTGHPAQFPLAVIDRIIKASSNPLGIVLDPFAGSCSAGIAALGLGRTFVGIELREDYCELAVQRYHQFILEKEEADRQACLI